MFFDYRKSVSRSFWILAIMNLVTYACYHTWYNLTTESGAESLITAFYYLHLAASKCCDFLLPVIIASIALLLYGKCNGRKWLICASILSTSVIFYTYNVFKYRCYGICVVIAHIKRIFIHDYYLSVFI